ncbi:MAG TPA: cyclic nucleotide-binding domain-containing protein [Candidatus Cloacimonadota bacterium]|nr:cyclic nucleotide-binding domain-containing protein [Candidatus Cloacimonadota bacterium]
MELVNREEKELIKFLKKVIIFKNVSSSDLRHISQYLYTRHYQAGEEVFKKGFPNEMFYIVKEGELVAYLSEKNEEIELNKYLPGGHFGSIGLFADLKRTASVKAVEDSVLLGISKKDLATFVRRFPNAGIEILYAFGKEFCENIITLNERLVKH